MRDVLIAHAFLTKLQRPIYARYCRPCNSDFGAAPRSRWRALQGRTHPPRLPHHSYTTQDALYWLAQGSNYESIVGRTKTVLTPNKVEYDRLARAMGIAEDAPFEEFLNRFAGIRVQTLKCSR